MELRGLFDDVFDDDLDNFFTTSYVSPFVFDSYDEENVDMKLIMEKIDVLQNMLDQMATENMSLKKRNNLLVQQLQTYHKNYQQLEKNYNLVPKAKK